MASPQVTAAKPAPAGAFGVPGDNPNFIFNATGLAASLGKTFSDHGIDRHGAMQNAALATLSGGHKGGSYFGLGFWGLDRPRGCGRARSARHLCPGGWHIRLDVMRACPSRAERQAALPSPVPVPPGMGLSLSGPIARS